MGTIVIIDDDRELRDTLRDVLEAEGWRIETAPDGALGLACVRTLVANGAPPALVLLDLMMPVMDGWQLSRALAEDSALAPIPVLVLSASGDTRHELHTRPMLRKPVNLDGLLDAVAKHARR
jgi:DNA-binding response OmpR family regulator